MASIIQPGVSANWIETNEVITTIAKRFFGEPCIPIFMFENHASTLGSAGKTGSGSQAEVFDADMGHSTSLSTSTSINTDSIRTASPSSSHFLYYLAKPSLLTYGLEYLISVCKFKATTITNVKFVISQGGNYVSSTGGNFDYQSVAHALFRVVAGSGSENWYAVTRNSVGTEQETNTGVALDTNVHVFKIKMYPTKVEFYIDGVLVATHSTVLPNDSALHYQSVAIITTEASAKNIIINTMGLGIVIQG